MQKKIRRLIVFVRSLHPNKRLNVDQIAWSQVSQISTYRLREIEKVHVGSAVRLRFIVKIETIPERCQARNVGFKKDMRIRLSDEAKHRDDRPGQYPRLFARQCGDQFAPTIKLFL